MSESELESEDVVFESNDELENHQQVYNTISGMFIERGYSDIMNDEKNNILYAKTYVFKHDIIAKICKDKEVDVGIVLKMIADLKKYIQPNTERTEPVDIDYYKTIVQNYPEVDFKAYKSALKKILVNSYKIVCAFCNICKKLSLSEIQTYLKQLQVFDKLKNDSHNSETKHIIIVCDSTTAPAIAAISDMKTEGIIIEYFQTDKVKVNITHHHLVPPHRELTDEEIDELAKKIKIDKLPIISSNDAVFRFLGCKKGKVIEVKRRNGNNLCDIAYRINHWVSEWNERAKMNERSEWIGEWATNQPIIL